jgi:hypothetical protein
MVCMAGFSMQGSCSLGRLSYVHAVNSLGWASIGLYCSQSRLSSRLIYMVVLTLAASQFYWVLYVFYC